MILTAILCSVAVTVALSALALTIPVAIIVNRLIDKVDNNK